MAAATLRQKDFYKAIESEESCIEYLKHKGLLLYNIEKCQRFRNGVICDSVLRECNRKNRKGEVIPTLRCSNTSCRTFVSIRKCNSFFTYTDLNGKCNSNLKLNEIMELVWMWLNFKTQVDAKKETKKCKQTICDWYNLCRDVCVKQFETRKPMGGKGQIVQIDESLFQVFIQCSVTLFQS